jgi:hypothetical protein
MELYRWLPARGKKENHCVSTIDPLVVNSIIVAEFFEREQSIEE